VFLLRVEERLHGGQLHVDVDRLAFEHLFTVQSTRIHINTNVSRMRRSKEDKVLPSHVVKDLRPEDKVKDLWFKDKDLKSEDKEKDLWSKDKNKELRT